MAKLASAPYVVIGAGMHGLSTAYHLAASLRERGQGSGADVVVLEKSQPGAGATGIACGVVRNNYFQPAMSELMQACVEVWESDPEAYALQPGRLHRPRPQGAGAAISRRPRAPRADRLPQRPDRRRGGRRRPHEGDVPGLARTGRDRLPPRAPGRLRVQPRVRPGPRAQVRTRGRPDPERRRGDAASSWARTALPRRSRRARAASRSASRSIVAPGPWAKRFWTMLGLPDTIDIRTPSGDVVRDQPMWTYWNLQEGEIQVDPLSYATADGSAPPVIHLDTDAPLHTDDGRLVTDELWGNYFKRDRHGVQGGAAPLTVDGDVELDPYPSTTNVDPGFADMWCASLSHAMSRFEGCRALYKEARSGGVGSFTADNFPVFDYLKPNVYAILDSNHGYKMIGVGREVAKVLLGEPLEPALPVPLRALRDRRPPPGLELALPLELTVGEPMVPPAVVVHDGGVLHGPDAHARMTRVIIFLLLGFAPWLMLLTLAHRALPDRGRAARARPHYGWWVFWLLLVFLTHFVGYLILRGYAYPPTPRARGTLGTARSGGSPSSSAVLAVAFLSARACQSEQRRLVRARRRARQGGGCLLARPHPGPARPTGHPGPPVLGRLARTTSAPTALPTKVEVYLVDRKTGDAHASRSAYVETLHRCAANCGRIRTWNGASGVSYGCAVPRAARGGRRMLSSIFVLAAERPGADQGAPGRAEARLADPDRAVLLLHRRDHVADPRRLHGVRGGRRASQEHHVDGDEEHPHDRRRHAELLLLRLVHLRLHGGGVAEDRPRLARRVPRLLRAHRALERGHGARTSRITSASSSSSRSSSSRGRRRRSCPARSSSASASRRT